MSDVKISLLSASVGVVAGTIVLGLATEEWLISFVGAALVGFPVCAGLLLAGLRMTKSGRNL
jgi:hypothetical protein